MDVLTQDIIPLSYSRLVNGQMVSGLTVAVMVQNVKTNATLLATVACPETASGSGFYFYGWVHGLNQDTSCVVTYTVNGKKYLEYIFISVGSTGGRAY